jgi:uncharacterized protein (TIGR03435 family)
MKIAALSWIALVGWNCLAQPAPINTDGSIPRFEVASVRLATDDSRRSWQGRRIQTAPGELATHGLTLRACLLWAYQQPAQIIAPNWVNEIALDITAKAAAPVGDDQLYLMLRTLLIERMGLQAHLERREMPAYALTIAKGGPKFSASATQGPEVIEQDKGALVVRWGTMKDLSAELSTGLFDRPVVDATGLNGRYDIRIDLAALAAVNQAADRADAASAMITLLQEQLGLKIEARKGEVDVLVVDHVEKAPTEN